MTEFNLRNAYDFSAESETPREVSIPEGPLTELMVRPTDFFKVSFAAPDMTVRGMPHPGAMTIEIQNLPRQVQLEEDGGYILKRVPTLSVRFQDDVVMTADLKDLSIWPISIEVLADNTEFYAIEARGAFSRTEKGKELGLPEHGPIALNSFLLTDADAPNAQHASNALTLSFGRREIGAHNGTIELFNLKGFGPQEALEPGANRWTLDVQSGLQGLPGDGAATQLKAPSTGRPDHIPSASQQFNASALLLVPMVGIVLARQWLGRQNSGLPDPKP